MLHDPGDLLDRPSIGINTGSNPQRDPPALGWPFPSAALPDVARHNAARFYIAGPTGLSEAPQADFKTHRLRDLT